MKALYRLAVIHYLSSGLYYLGFHELLMRFVAGVSALAIIAVLRHEFDKHKRDSL